MQTIKVQCFRSDGYGIGEVHTHGGRPDEGGYTVAAEKWACRYVAAMLAYEWITHVIVECSDGWKVIVRKRVNG